MNFALDELIRTTDSRGDVAPRFLAGATSEEAIKMGLLEERPLNSTTPGMPPVWLRLTPKGQDLKAKLNG